MPENFTRFMPPPQTQAHQPEPTITMLFRAAIGPINTDFYLPIFTRFEASGRAGLSWNWAASLCTFNWLVFRGLRGYALVYLAVLVFLPLLTLGLGRLVLNWSELAELLVGLTGLVLLFVLPGIGGNALFYRATRKNLEAAIVASAKLEQACKLLVGQSSSRQRFIRILVGNSALLCVVLPLCMPLLTRYSSETETTASSATGRVQEAPASAPLPSAFQPLNVASSPVQSVALGTLPSEPVPAVSMPQPVASAPILAASVPARMPSEPVRRASAPVTTASVPASEVSAPVTVASASVLSVSSPKRLPSKPASVGHFYVNVGLFANATNAQRVQDKLRNARLPVINQRVHGVKGELIRVRVGPFAGLNQAGEAARKIKALNLDAVVVRL